MAVLVPAALLAALGSGFTVWREIPVLVDSTTRIEKVVERMELRVTALEAVRWQVGAELKDCQRRLDVMENNGGSR